MKLITYFQEGRLIRYDPRVVAQFILQRTVQARMSRGPAVSVALEPGQFALLEERMQRFLSEQVRDFFATKERKEHKDRRVAA